MKYVVEVMDTGCLATCTGEQKGCTYSLLPTPAALLQKTALSVFPAQPLMADAGYPLFPYSCLSYFSRGQEKAKFSLVSPR